MNRNTEMHFAELPKIDIQRSRFDLSHDVTTSFNAADLVPLATYEVLPGSTYNIDMSAVVRMATPIFPVMDNCWIDFYAFFVPERLTWEHFREFMGENTQDHWTPSVTYTKPMTSAPTGGWEVGTIADYMGIPTGVEGIEVDSTYFRGYSLIWNEWFRSEPLKDPASIHLDDSNQTGSNGGTYITDLELGGKPAKVARVHDYFSSCLPGTQYGEAVNVPLGSFAPITTTDTITGNIDGNPLIMGLHKTNGFYTSELFNTLDSAGDWQSNWKYNANNLTQAFNESLETESAFKPLNLVTDLSAATGSTVNQLRMAFQLQKYMEAMARGGNRYREQLMNIWRVTSSDARMQIPEYLGGYRCPINISAVLQTSSTDNVSPQGNASGYSQTNTARSLFTRSFEEHGRIFILGAVRTARSYSQGLPRKFSRKTKEQYYVPQLANIGEQAVLLKELWATGTSTDEEAFGYQEAWAEYRYHPNVVTGEMRPTYAQSLAAWHYGDMYTERPYLSTDWIDETTANVDRTIAVQSSVSNQFWANFHFKVYATMPMPVYSVPGLIDHH